MRAGLIVYKVCKDRRKNLDTVLHWAEEAARAGAEIVLFPEAALSGLINNDVPAHDLPLGETIPGPATAALSALARKRGMWLGIGMLERDGGSLYDSAILIGSDGAIHLHYRRNQPQWHGSKADPNVYRQGTGIPVVTTPLGSVAILICGDLFDDNILTDFRHLRPDWLLFPFARCFSDGTADQARWDREEFPLYIERVRKAATPTLMVNYIGTDLPDDNSFGGAFFISPEGRVLASLPLAEEGLLMIDSDNTSNKADACDATKRA